MLPVLWIYAALCAGELGEWTVIEETSLQTGQAFLENLNNSRAVLNHDGSFLFFERHTVWHFHKNGSLIRRFGEQGQGPGEFERILGGVLTEDGRYLVYDAMTHMVKIFSDSGVYLAANPIPPIRNLLLLEGRLYGVNLRHMMKHFGAVRKRGAYLADVYNDLKKGAVFYELHLNDRHELAMADEGFFNYTDALIKSWFLWSWHYIQADARHFYIMQAMDNKVRRHDRRSKRYQGGFSAQLKLYEPPPQNLAVPRENQARKKYLDAWSRIYAFEKLDEGFLIGFNAPSVVAADERMRSFQVVDSAGAPVSQPFNTGDVLIGARGRAVFFLHLDDSGERSRYSVKTYRFGAGGR